MEFQLGGHKRTWMTLSSTEVKQCEANTLEKLYRGGAHCFAILATTETPPMEEPLHILEQVKELLAKYEKVTGVPTSLPLARPFDHSIILEDESKPVRVPPYRYAHFQKEEIERQVTEMLQNGIIRSSSSPFLSPILLAKKKDGSWRFCTDYHAMPQR